MQVAGKPILAKTSRILEELTEVKELQQLNHSRTTAEGGGLDKEIAFSEASTQWGSFFTPIRDEVTEMIETSKTLKETMVFLNTNLKRGAHQRPKSQDKPTYAGMAGKKPSHAIIVQSTDPTKTGDQVIRTLQDTLDCKRSGITVDRVRKAKDRKVVLYCVDSSGARRVEERIRTDKSLKVQKASTTNPQVRVVNVLAYHTDTDIVEHLRAQNADVFKDLKEEENVLKVRYRKRARNALQCHPVLEVAPIVHRRLLEKGTVHIGLERRQVVDQSPLVQCPRCLGFGHTAVHCRDKAPTCSYCGGSHPWGDCKDRETGKDPHCKNCERAKTTGAEPHIAFSPNCPQRVIWDKIARSKVSYC